eukprot:TRINITY_DN10575_c0_g1_i1.p1 TRINITY_DN10575_c0_g1~~TRINITY_DN10575_c0_g1_i1.p1  ORF type:complete len:107 (+),score=4.88 TRINITY_DN10575_c0_g1_i1:797-1117(+)
MPPHQHDHEWRSPCCCSVASLTPFMLFTICRAARRLAMIAVFGACAQEMVNAHNISSVAVPSGLAFMNSCPHTSTTMNGDHRVAAASLRSHRSCSLPFVAPHAGWP